MRLTITSEAFEDLADISEFGAERWGEASARPYTDALVARLNRLAVYPELGPRDDKQVGFRRLTLDRHVAYYRMREDEVIVVRILHASQDPGFHLP